MRWLSNGSKDRDQCCTGARQDRPNEGEASKALMEEKGCESGIEHEAGLEISATVSTTIMRTTAYRLQGG